MRNGPVKTFLFQTARALARAGSIALVLIGLAASLASASPKTLQDATLSIQDLITDLASIEEVTAINDGKLTAVASVSSSNVENDRMLGPVVNIVAVQPPSANHSASEKPGYP